MAKKAAVKKGTVQVTKLSQGIGYVGLFQAGDHRLRVKAEYDSYRDQSSATVQRWNGEEWKEVYSLRGHALTGWSDGIAYRQGAAVEQTFSTDVHFLLDRAEEVLGF